MCISPCLSKCSVSHTGICFLSLNWALIVFQSCVASIMICMKNAYAVEMMIRIPVVMTGEIESWPCEELMYCSRANVWQEWGFAVQTRVAHTASVILCNNWLKKTKYCGKGHLRGACRSKICLHHPWPWFSTNWLCPCQEGEEKRHTGKRKERKQRCFGSCLDPHSPPKPCLCQVTLVLTQGGHAFSSFCFFFYFFVLLLFFFFSFLFFSWFKQALNTSLKTKADGRHLDPCS